MRWTGLEKQMLIEFNRQINGRDAEIVTIRYYIKRPDITNENWQQSEGVLWQYNNVRCLKETISDGTFSDSAVAGVLLGKANFRFPYIASDSNGNQIFYDFHGNIKKFIKIIDQNGQEYPIDKIFPQVRIGNRYLNWCAIQK